MVEEAVASGRTDQQAGGATVIAVQEFMARLAGRSTTPMRMLLNRCWKKASKPTRHSDSLPAEADVQVKDIVKLRTAA